MSLRVEKVADQTYVLLEDFSRSSSEYIVTIKSGFDFDGASIPQVFWSVLGSPMTGDYVEAAVIHDGLYASEILDRKTADTIFKELMLKDGVSFLKRSVIYLAVRVGGRYVWKTHNKDEVIRYKEFVNVDKINK